MSPFIGDLDKEYRERTPVWVCFCRHSFGPVFYSERLALEWVTQKEIDGEYWSVTRGLLSLNTPGR